MKKQLLLVVEAVQTNGAIKGLLDFLRAVDREEYDIDMFLFDHTKYEGIDVPDFVNVLPEDPHCVVERVGFGAAVRYALKKGRVDLAVKRVVYSVLQRHSPRFRKWNLALPAARLKKRYDVAIGGTMGATWEFVGRKVDADKKLIWLDTNIHFGGWMVYWNHFKHYVEELDALVCVSRSTRDRMRKEFPEWADKIHVINYVIWEERILAMANGNSGLPDKKKFRLVTVGRYCGQKGVTLIEPIAELLVRAGMDFEWYVVAPGSGRVGNQAEINLLLDRHGVRDRVFFTECTPNPFAAMVTADLYVQPSEFEGYGLTVSEALVCGRYVVATDIDEFREQIEDEGIGMLAQFSPESFASAILAAVEVVKKGVNRKNYRTPYSPGLVREQFGRVLTVAEKVRI